MQTKQAPPASVFPNIDVPVPYRLTPLARAALANGVSFDDVQAYVTGQSDGARSLDYVTAVYKEQFDGSAPDDEREDVALDGALLRSVLAKGTVEHARLWWGGVL